MASTDPARPNILVVLTDDQGSWTLPAAGATELHTPTLDRLAMEGTRLSNFFCVVRDATDRSAR
jgi:choline-sulfatase